MAAAAGYMFFLTECSMLHLITDASFRMQFSYVINFHFGAAVDFTDKHTTWNREPLDEMKWPNAVSPCSNSLHVLILGWHSIAQLKYVCQHEQFPKQ